MTTVGIPNPLWPTSSLGAFVNLILLSVSPLTDPICELLVHPSCNFCRFLDPGNILYRFRNPQSCYLRFTEYSVKPRVIRLLLQRFAEGMDSLVGTFCDLI